MLLKKTLHFQAQMCVLSTTFVVDRHKLFITDKHKIMALNNLAYLNVKCANRLFEQDNYFLIL